MKLRLFWELRRLGILGVVLWIHLSKSGSNHFLICFKLCNVMSPPPTPFLLFVRGIFPVYVPYKCIKIIKNIKKGKMKGYICWDLFRPVWIKRSALLNKPINYLSIKSIKKKRQQSYYKSPVQWKKASEQICGIRSRAGEVSVSGFGLWMVRQTSFDLCITHNTLTLETHVKTAHSL